jgi:hypothetical protein
MTDPLAAAEAEMAAEAFRARARYTVAVAWLRSADRDLAGLRRVTWGGPVDQWHRAADAVADSAEAVAAYEAFGTVD